MMKIIMKFTMMLPQKILRYPVCLCQVRDNQQQTKRSVISFASTCYLNTWLKPAPSQRQEQH